MAVTGALPQLEGGPFLTDGGLETDLIFNRGAKLPEFAAFDLLKDEEGTELLREYFREYLTLAAKHGVGVVLESPTWRASRGWGERIGYSPREVEQMNRRAIALMEELRDEHAGGGPVVISGCVGPQDDGYNPSQLLSAEQAAEYHSHQIGTFADTAADQITAITMTYADEAVGVTNAATDAGLPVAISFTVETDGSLPSGQGLADAIAETDERTEGAPAYFMLNCAHPTHFEDTVAGDGPWRDRILGLRANASTKSHAELDNAAELDDGDPADLGRRYAALREHLPNLTVLGGCCGTDHRHVAAIFESWPETRAG